MFVQQRMLAAKLAVKSRSREDYLQGLGIEIVYEEKESNTEGGNNDGEKDSNRNYEAGKHPVQE